MTLLEIAIVITATLVLFGLSSKVKEIQERLNLLEEQKPKIIALDKRAEDLTLNAKQTIIIPVALDTTYTFVTRDEIRSASTPSEIKFEQGLASNSGTLKVGKITEKTAWVTIETTTRKIELALQPDPNSKTPTRWWIEN